MHILQFEKSVQLIFGRSLVVRQVRSTQDEPPPLPGLFVSPGGERDNTKAKHIIH